MSVVFPALAGQGLKLVNVRGDGNCLFRAISDQLYGNQGSHGEIRAKVVDYLRNHPVDFKDFMAVGLRRQHVAMRRCAPKPATSTAGPTWAERNAAWEKYLHKMAQSGTYAGQLEITAFAKVYNMDIIVHQSVPEKNVYTWAADYKKMPRHIIHVALANEHYQSVRNINGPHQGRANTLPKGMEPLRKRRAVYKAKFRQYKAPVRAAAAERAKSPSSSPRLAPETSGDEKTPAPVGKLVPAEEPSRDLIIKAARRSNPPRKRKQDDSSSPPPKRACMPIPGLSFLNKYEDDESDDD